MNKALKHRVMQCIQNHPMERKQIMEKLGIDTKSLSNAFYQLKADGVKLKKNGNQYSVKEMAVVVAESKTKEPQSDIKDMIAAFQHVHPSGREDALDLLQKSLFYRGALDSHLKASKITSELRRAICDPLQSI